jgi:hypothetical protein
MIDEMLALHFPVFWLSCVFLVFVKRHLHFLGRVACQPDCFTNILRDLGTKAALSQQRVNSLRLIPAWK